MNESVGVIVGRFQCAELTIGHTELIDFVQEQDHNQVLIVLGVAGTPCTKNNPLHFTARVAMMRELYPQFIYMPQHDNPSDEIWSENLDDIIQKCFPYTDNITLYGSRDSFKNCYHGKFNVIEFKPKTYDNATERREKYGSSVGFNKDYRHGVIYGAYQKFDTCYQTVDVVVFTKLSAMVEDCEIVVGKKRIYGDKWILPGGFVDPARDKNLRDTCYYEVLEETNLKIVNPVYVDSLIVNDYRYKRERDKIMSHLHYATVENYSSLKAGDDLDSVEIIKLSRETINDMNQSYQSLVEMVIKHLKLTFEWQKKL
jgi:bifunctional NMN adenylyltransferase/nudix hydrolase